MNSHRTLLVLVALALLTPSWACSTRVLLTEPPGLSLIGRYETGLFDVGAAEIAAYDTATRRLFFVRGQANQVVALHIADPAAPKEAFTIDMHPFGKKVNSVATSHGVVAVAAEADPAQAPGSVVFFDTDSRLLGRIRVGALPDALAFTPDGSKLLVANEGEPSDDYSVDPEGSVSIVDLSDGVGTARVTHVGFAEFNAGRSRAAELPAGVRIFGPDASVAQDLEPEFVAVAPDGSKAYVTLQENNAIALIDVATASVDRIVALGVKDHAGAANALDTSDRDGGIRIRNWPIHGMYQPDGIATCRIGREVFLVTANEGETRDYDEFSEKTRVSKLRLDSSAFPDADELQDDERLGRLWTTTEEGDTDEDGDHDEIFSYGTRSFSIWRPDGKLVYDSADDFERTIARLLPDQFNSTNEKNDSFDDRSVDKGPEPEGVAVGTVGTSTYAFIGLERVGGVMVYDLSDPLNPRFVEYVHNRDFTGDAEAGTGGDLGPEGLLFIPAAESPNGVDLLVVANEVSGSVSIYEFARESDRLRRPARVLGLSPGG